MKKNNLFLPILLAFPLVFMSGNLLAQTPQKPAAKPSLNKAEIEKDAKKEAALHCELGKLENEEIELEDDEKRPALNAKIEAAGNALEKYNRLMGEKYSSEKNKAANDLYLKFFKAELSKCKTPRPD